MEQIISKLTHDNNLFNEQWSDIYDQLRSIPLPKNGRLVLHALVDYILDDPPTPDDIKYHLIDLVLDQLDSSEISLDTPDLVKAFTRVLQSSCIDLWRLYFLTTIYQKFQIGERIFSHPSKEDFLKEILSNLQIQSFEIHEEKWEILLTQNLFSPSTDESNALNQADTQTQFKEFYQHAIAQSVKSSIWSELATLLRETVFVNVVNLTDPMTKIENCFLQNRFDDTPSIVSNLDWSGIDLEKFLRSLIRYCAMVEDRNAFCSNFLPPCVHKLLDLSVEKRYASLYFELTLTILKLLSSNAPDLAYHLLRKENFYSWKDLIDGLVEIFQTCISYDQVENEEYFSDLNELENILSLIVKRAPTYRQLFTRIQPLAFDTILRWADVQFQGGYHVYRMGCVLFECINVEQITEEACGKIIDILQGHVNSDLKENRSKTRFFLNDLFGKLANRIEHSKRLSSQNHRKLSNLCLSILDQPLFDEEQNMTFEHALLGTFTFKAAQTISLENDGQLYEKFLDRMFKEAKEQNNSMLYQWWSGFWIIVGYKLPNLTRNHCEQFLEYTLTTKQINLVTVSIAPCLQQPKIVCRHFDVLMQMLLADDGQNLTYFTYLLTSVIQKYPEMISIEHLQQIFSLVESIPFNSFLESILHSLGAVANHQPQLFDNSREKLIQLIIEQQSLVILDCLRKYLIASMIIHRSENQARESLKLLVGILQHPKCSNDLRNGVVYTCLLIGLKYRQVLTDRRDDFVKFNSDLIAHFIEQTTNDKNEELIIKQAGEEIESIERKIKIQEVFLPSWTREVIKLLNPRSDHDWRSLGKQLGFSASEIKHWAMQNDPCLALLKEWFRSYQTDQAIAGLLKALTEIKRQDAEQIIRRALPSTILPVDLKRLPPILLSYHSSERTFMTKLKDHLNEAGYLSQMDDEQTDLNTVETHIGGVKVVVCAMNGLYSQSEICVKHCRLNLKMKKPVIYLHIEGQSWPPEGSLKPILQHFLHIPFLHEKEESSQWPERKFLELLAQVRYYSAPDPDLAHGNYRHWFVPRLDTLIFFQSSATEKNDLSTLFTDIPLVVSHPQIVLSYQWDCQKDALNLYRQLTQFGYRIWLDLFQMGGGDSLLEKFHFSLRQSSCLLACITPKYIKSAHYQTEFLVAKNLNKPILCLLLEETNPWPPNGVELPLFADKSYIDFRNLSGNDRWTGKSFAMLLAQLKKLLPQIETDKPRHILNMQRPSSAFPKNTDLDPSLKRRSSAPMIPQSRACSLM